VGGRKGKGNGDDDDAKLSCLSSLSFPFTSLHTRQSERMAYRPPPPPSNPNQPTAYGGGQNPAFINHQVAQQQQYHLQQQQQQQQYAHQQQQQQQRPPPPPPQPVVPTEYVYFERNPQSFKKDTLEKGQAAKLKLEHYYQKMVQEAIERNTR